MSTRRKGNDNSTKSSNSSSSRTNSTTRSSSSGKTAVSSNNPNTAITYAVALLVVIILLSVSLGTGMVRVSPSRSPSSTPPSSSHNNNYVSSSSHPTHNLKQEREALKKQAKSKPPSYQATPKVLRSFDVGGDYRRINVSRRVWTGEKYRAIGEGRRPLILRGGLLDQWKATSLWKPSWLMKELPAVSVQQQYNVRAFATFHDNKPMESMLKDIITWEDFNIYSKIKSKYVLGIDKDPANLTNWSYYFTSKLWSLSGTSKQDLLTHIQPFQELLLSDSYQSNLWMGKPGLVTHTHYDTQYNFFVQIHGRKRFTLFPPSTTRSNGGPLPIYPCLHPHYGHLAPAPSPHPFPRINNETTSSSTLPLAYIAELRAGDMLVVPPFWWHHVETLETSVSVNIWSTAPEYNLVESAYELPIPFEAEWNKSMNAIAIHAYVTPLINGISSTPSAGHENAQSYILDYLLPQRYQLLVENQLLPVNQSIVNEYSLVCGEGFHHMRSLSAQHFGVDVPSFQRGLIKLIPLFNEMKSISINTPATPIHSSTDNMEEGTSDPNLAYPELNMNDEQQNTAIQRLLLGNYIEHLINTLLGTDHVYPYLSQCFK